MTPKLRTSSTVAPHILRTRSAPAPQTCVSGREGKGREEEWRRTDVSLHASLQTVETKLAPTGQTAPNPSASMHGGYAAGELA